MLRRNIINALFTRAAQTRSTMTTDRPAHPQGRAEPRLPPTGVNEAGGGPAFPGERPRISVVVPMHNESGNVLPLLQEIEAALSPHAPFEAVVVDDHSSDDTLARLAQAARTRPWLTVLSHRRNAGQSTAVVNGVQRARGHLVATIDGDGQNPPAEIPKLMARWAEVAAAHPGRPVLIAGWRAARNDTWVRRMSSRIANGVRARLLGDATPDTGCGLKLMAREHFLRLPYFDHMHRFLPALVQREGGVVESVHVNHRPRTQGRSHYGIHNRLWVGLVDLCGVMWLQRRARPTPVDRLDREQPT